MGTGSFPRVNRPGRGVDHAPASRAEVKERIELYFYSSFGPSWPVLRRTLPLPLTLTPFIHSFILSFIHFIIYLFIYLFMCVYVFIYLLFIYLFIYTRSNGLMMA